MIENETFVIVGASLAGAKAAEALRDEGFDGRVVLIGDEPERPYERPPLTKDYLRGDAPREQTYVHSDFFYGARDIDLITDTTVTAVDPGRARITLDDGRELDYDRLLLTTGAEPKRIRVPGAELDGVFGLRTLGDADALAARMKQARNVVVVGAGFIGLEFAAVAAASGASVHVLELGIRPMARALTSEMSNAFQLAHEGWGVRLDFRQGLARIGGSNGRVESVETTDGRKLPADLVVFGIGVLPNVRCRRLTRA